MPMEHTQQSVIAILVSASAGQNFTVGDAVNKIANWESGHNGRIVLVDLKYILDSDTKML